MKKKLIDIGICSNSVSRNHFAQNLIKKKFSSYKFNPLKKLKGNELIDYLRDCKFAIIGTEIINAKIIENLPNLKAIGKYGVGTDKIDLNCIKKKGIKFFHFNGFNKRAVSELVLGYIINCLRNLNYLNDQIKNYNYWLALEGENLTNKRIGIIGCGNIGKDLIKLLQPFNSKISVNDLIYDQKFINRYSLKKLSKNKIFEYSDIITIHIPMNKKNSNIFDKKYLKNLKNGSVIINTARGGLFNENDLYDYLKKNEKSKAYFDVLEVEPPIKNNKLFKLNNFFISSHIGGSTNQAIELGTKLCIDSLSRIKNEQI